MNNTCLEFKLDAGVVTLQLAERLAAQAPLRAARGRLAEQQARLDGLKAKAAVLQRALASVAAEINDVQRVISAHNPCRC